MYCSIHYELKQVHVRKREIRQVSLRYGALHYTMDKEEIKM